MISSPNVGSNSDYLYGVATVSANDVWAVGTDITYSGNQHVALTLTEHWDGTNWSIIPSPNPGLNDNFLNGVATVSTSNAWAVGYYITSSVQHVTLIEHWNGTSWSVVPSPNVVGSSVNVLYGIAAISISNIWAVGDDTNTSGSTSITQTLIEHWDGTSWNIVPSANIGTSPNILKGVARVPHANKLWAVGYYDTSGGTPQTLIEHWNGTRWRIAFSQDFGFDYLNGVAVVSANNAWAVGYYYNTSTHTDQALIGHWNGTSWSIVSNPNPGLNDDLYGVARVRDTNQLWSVGSQNNSNALSEQTLTEFYC